MRRFQISKINLYTIFRDLLYNWWIIILAFLIGFVGCHGYYNYIYEANYISTMTLSVNLSGYTTNAAALSLSRTVVIAETLDDVFQSSAIRDLVREEFGEGITASIAARQVGKTNLVQISVNDKNPEQAYNVMTLVAKNYHKVTDLAFSNVIINVIVNPTMPSTVDVTAAARRIGTLAGIFMVVLVSMGIVLISYSRDTVKNISDVESELNTKLFGLVYRVKRLSKKLPKAKQRVLLTNPLVGSSFAASFRKMAVKVESLRRTKGYKSFFVTSVAESEGKTTVTVNLAVSLAQNSHRVLLIDCDFKNPSVKKFFENIPRNENSDFHEFLDNGGDITHYIKHDPETGLYIADNMNYCTNSAEKLNSRRFHDAIKALREQFDFVIIDTPPCGITIDPEIVSGVAEASLVVIRQDVVPVEQINDQIENLNKCYHAGCIFNDVATIRKHVAEGMEFGLYESVR